MKLTYGDWSYIFLLLALILIFIKGIMNKSKEDSEVSDKRIKQEEINKDLDSYFK